MNSSAKINLDVDDIVSPNRGLTKFPTIGLDSVIKVSDLATEVGMGRDITSYHLKYIATIH